MIYLTIVLLCKRKVSGSFQKKIFIFKVSVIFWWCVGEIQGILKIWECGDGVWVRTRGAPISGSEGMVCGWGTGEPLYLGVRGWCVGEVQGSPHIYVCVEYKEWRGTGLESGHQVPCHVWQRKKTFSPKRSQMREEEHFSSKRSQMREEEDLLLPTLTNERGRIPSIPNSHKWERKKTLSSNSHKWESKKTLSSKRSQMSEEEDPLL